MNNDERNAIGYTLPHLLHILTVPYIVAWPPQQSTRCACATHNRTLARLDECDTMRRIMCRSPLHHAACRIIAPKTHVGKHRRHDEYIRH